MLQRPSSSKWSTIITQWKMQAIRDNHLPIFDDRCRERNILKHYVHNKFEVDHVMPPEILQSCVLKNAISNNFSMLWEER
jgi:hypothetical protein